MANLTKEPGKQTRRWQKNHSVFIEDCAFENDGVNVMFCKYMDRNNVEAEWHHAFIKRVALEAFTLERLKEDCIDKPDPVTGEHIQVSTHINEAAAAASVVEYLQMYVRKYIEAAQPYTIIQPSNNK